MDSNNIEAIHVLTKLMDHSIVLPDDLRVKAIAKLQELITRL